MVGAHLFNDKEAFILLKVAIEREGARPRLQIVMASIAPTCCYRESYIVRIFFSSVVSCMKV